MDYLGFARKVERNASLRMVLIAELGAISIVLAKFTKFPIFAAAPFLKMDLGELPLLLAVMLLPGRSGLFALVVKEMLSFFCFGTNPLSLTADFLACGCFLLVFQMLYQNGTSGKRFAAAVTVSALLRMLVSIPLNLVILQLQYGSTVAVIVAQLPYIILFNGLKCLLDGVCMIPLLRRL